MGADIVARGARPGCVPRTMELMNEPSFGAERGILQVMDHPVGPFKIRPGPCASDGRSTKTRARPITTWAHTVRRVFSADLLGMIAAECVDRN